MADVMNLNTGEVYSYGGLDPKTSLVYAYAVYEHLPETGEIVNHADALTRFENKIVEGKHTWGLGDLGVFKDGRDIQGLAKTPAQHFLTSCIGDWESLIPLMSREAVEAIADEAARMCQAYACVSGYLEQWRLHQNPEAAHVKAEEYRRRVRKALGYTYP